MRRFLAALLAICILVGGTAYAIEPADEPEERTITVEDVIAVSAELLDYSEEIDMMAKVILEEAGGVKSKMERAAVCQVILNRVDVYLKKEGAEDTTENRKKAIARIIKAPHQFIWNPRAKVLEEHRELAKDVLTRWLLEARGITDVGRVIPKDYLWFAGRGGHNWFRNKYYSRNYWDWSLPDPYEEDEEWKG